MSLQEVDRQIYLAIEEEKKRQENGIELINLVKTLFLKQF